MTGTDTGTASPSQHGYGPSMMRGVVVAVLCCCHCAADILAASVVIGADHPGVVLAANIFNVFCVPQTLRPLAVGSAVGLPC